MVNYKSKLHIKKEKKDLIKFYIYLQMNNNSKKKKMKFFLLYFIILFVNLNGGEITTLTYEKTSGKGTYRTTYTIDSKENEFLIKIESKDQNTELETTKSYVLKNFIYKSKKNKDEYTFVATNSGIKALGEIKGNKMEATFEVDPKNPWIQEFDFGLRPFLSSQKSAINFELINPKTFKTHKMVAKKQGIESVMIGDKNYQAEVVHITLQGFKSMFWKALVWYDVKTQDLLMYKSNEGPHTPTTTIQLLSKETKKGS